MPTLTLGALIWIVTTSAAPGPVPFRLDAAIDTAAIRDHGRVARTGAQGGPARTTMGREFFVSWGYNGDAYANSDLHISQPAIGNDFTLHDVSIRDSKTWTDLFNHSLFVPQYNFRLGVFFNERWGLEIALDHMKWIVREDQQVRISGTLDGSAVDEPITLTSDVLRYQLNNGANPIFFNLIRRFQVAGRPYQAGHITFFAKGGGGFAWPHTENTLFGQPNDKGFQPFQGWNLDAAAAIRLHLWKPFYFEAEEKLVYARYFGVKVDRGTARHSVKANEFTFNFGMVFR